MTTYHHLQQFMKKIIHCTRRPAANAAAQKFSLICLLAVASCNTSQAQPEHANRAANASQLSAAAQADKLEVPTEGKEFKPPVRPDQLPTGAWYCDMGLVHWAQLKEGNRQCPLCKMELKQKK